MEKEFVTYPLALRLKALGFKERVLTYFEDDKIKLHDHISGWDFNSSFLNCVSRPTYSQIFRWFREQKGLCVTFEYDENEGEVYWYIGKCFEYGVGPLFFHDLGEFTKLEEAELACLEKLIEIVEGYGQRIG